MPTFDTTAPRPARNDKLFTTREYPMKIVGAKVAPKRKFNTDDPDVDELTIVFELDPENEQQSQEFESAGYYLEEREGWRRVWDHMPPWHDTGRRGPSKLMTRIQPFIDADLVPAQYDVADGDRPETEGDLVGLKCYAFVEQYIKSMGPNAGTPGERILAIRPRANGNQPGLMAPATPQPDATANGTPGESQDAYLDTLYASFEAGELDGQLADVATELAPATNNPFWQKKNFAERNAEQLKMDIQTMWGMVLRHRKESASGALQW